MTTMGGISCNLNSRKLFVKIVSYFKLIKSGKWLRASTAALGLFRVVREQWRRIIAQRGKISQAPNQKAFLKVWLRGDCFGGAVHTCYMGGGCNITTNGFWGKETGEVLAKTSSNLQKPSFCFRINLSSVIICFRQWIIFILERSWISFVSTAAKSAQARVRR